METFAVTVFPVAKPGEWRAWIDSIASGDWAGAHRQMMRRLGIKREHIRHQASPPGDVMVLVWEGVEQDRAPELLANLVQNPVPCQNSTRGLTCCFTLGACAHPSRLRVHGPNAGPEPMNKFWHGTGSAWRSGFKAS
jgi:hypothetical protein